MPRWKSAENNTMIRQLVEAPLSTNHASVF